MKNPGALAGATGADVSKFVYESEHNRIRAACATELAAAIGECHPEDAAQIMTAALFDLLPEGPRRSVFVSAEEDSAWWASMAAPHELSAMLAAVLEHLGGKALHLNMRKRILVQLFETLPATARVAFLRRTDPTGRFVRRVA